ncbi:hypothetical protein ACIRP2_05675 [Streptomyces sp. NPDC101194]|uniref:hypothetical protein n=1 Tax=Streptomyces sp. NPDC101194 TaxID=3366127 RepID=UPI00382897E0
MTARRWAAATAAAVTLAGTALATATAAQAQEEPTYRCAVVWSTAGNPRAEGEDCTALNGAPERGPIYGAFRIEGIFDGGTVRCQIPPGIPDPYFVTGIASLPSRVEGRLCLHVE